MKNTISSMRILLPLALFFGVNVAFAQSPKTLGIGDEAPELKYAKWIKGEPIKSFEGNKLYILEFWATWCGPCKAAMPHITKLQKEYKDKAKFIGVGVWEKVPSGQPYESSLPSVVKYVEGNDINMGYDVIADNNEQYMGNNWLRAAGENGIPSTFIVRNNKIIWIGHPNSLDSILPQMFAGTYNMQAYKTKFKKSADASREMADQMKANMQPIQDALKAKDFATAFSLMDQLKVSQPHMKVPMDMMKLSTLVDNFPLKDVQKFAAEWDYKSANSLILGDIYNKANLPKETYLWAASNFGSTAELTNPLIFDALATCYAKGGEYAKAVENQQKALEIAAKALKEGTMVGTIMDYTVADYQAKLDKYKLAAKQ